MYSSYLKRTFEKVEGLYEAFLAFCARFPDEAACRSHVLHAILRLGKIICQNCNFPNQHEDASQRSFRCAKCKKLVWITAGTNFEQVELFRPWLAAQWLMEAGIKVNPFQLSKLFECNYSTAHTISKTINYQLASLMSEDSQSVPSAAFAAAFYRRSRETPAGEHPVEEERRAQDLAAERHQKSKAKSDSSMRRFLQPQAATEVNATVELSDDEQRVFSFIDGEPIHFDSLCELTDLPAENLSVLLMSLVLKNAIRNEFGDKYTRQNLVTLLRSDVWPKTAISSKSSSSGKVKAILKHIRAMYQGISRKYLQLYVANFLFFENLEDWRGGKLLDLLIKTRKVKYDRILEYVTELQVSIAPADKCTKAKT